MAHLNQTCKECGEKYHYCSNCGCDGYSELGFCCEGCYNEHYKEDELKIETIYNSMTELQKALLLAILEDIDYGELTLKVIDRIRSK